MRLKADHHHSNILTPFFFFFLQNSEAEHMQHSKPQACMKSELVCFSQNNSYGCMIPNSRNTTCWLLPEIGPVSHCVLRRPEGLKQSSSGDYGATGDLVWSQLLGPCSVYILISNTKPPSSLVQMDVCLDSGPEQDFTVISAEGDSENIALGFQPAGKLLRSSVNREITSRKHGGGKKGLSLSLSLA